jgi:hypothetical protein
MEVFWQTSHKMEGTNEFHAELRTITVFRWRNQAIGRRKSCFRRPKRFGRPEKRTVLDQKAIAR